MSTSSADAKLENPDWYFTPSYMAIKLKRTSYRTGRLANVSQTRKNTDTAYLYKQDVSVVVVLVNQEKKI